jgi:hypothetical protein
MVRNRQSAPSRLEGGGYEGEKGQWLFTVPLGARACIDSLPPAAYDSARSQQRCEREPCSARRESLRSSGRRRPVRSPSSSAVAIPIKRSGSFGPAPVKASGRSLARSVPSRTSNDVPRRARP